jgi:ribonuclease HI
MIHPAERPIVDFVKIANSEDMLPYCNADTVQVFTDGSKHNEMVGAAYVMIYPDGRQYTKRLKLHRSCTVYQAECLAIEMACNKCTQDRLQHVAIFSMTALQELTNRNSTQQMIHNIQRHIKEITETGVL